MGGLLRPMPFVGAVLTMAMFAACGLPGFANFPGEALVFFGAWERHPAVVVVAAWAALVIGAVYAVRAVRVMLQGPVAPCWGGLRDAPNAWRCVPFLLLLGGLLLFGCCPRLLTDRIQPSAIGIAQAVGAPDLAGVNSACVGGEMWVRRD
jgi:NADH-quinone oxidoreductase subunit M